MSTGINLCSPTTPVVCTLSPMYQLMNDDFPALWLPMIITFTFLRGFRGVGCGNFHNTSFCRDQNTGTNR
jgi:hypothetical protein